MTKHKIPMTDDPKYRTEYIEALSGVDLSLKMNAFYARTYGISIRDVAYLMEMRANRLNPQQVQAVFICIITFKLLPEGAN